jgi:CDP-diacylglycerol--serine O-phosphatidyltransferase
MEAKQFYLRKRMKSFKLSKAIIPNSFTAANLLSGFASIVLASDNNFRLAAIFILIGAVFDSVDGMIARLVGTSSEFGVELDSLADVVTFGIAPGFLIYNTYLHQLGTWGMIVASLIPLFGAFRLARFNIQVEDVSLKIDFRGLPIPTTAIIIASMVLAYFNEAKFNETLTIIIIPTIIILSLLMVSNVRYDSLANVTKKSRKVKIIYFAIFILLLLLGTFTINEILLFIFGTFALYGVFKQIYLFIFPSKAAEQNSNGD